MDIVKQASQICVDVALETTTLSRVITNDKTNFIDYVPILKVSMQHWVDLLTDSIEMFSSIGDNRANILTETRDNLNRTLSIDTVLWFAFGAEKILISLEDLMLSLFSVAEPSATIAELIGTEPVDKTEAEINRIFKKISNVAPENDKMAWRRLRRELTKHLEELETHNATYFEIQAKRKPLMDHIEELRKKMVTECVHPSDELVYKSTHVLCKFCNKRLRLLNG